MKDRVSIFILELLCPLAKENWIPGTSRFMCEASAPGST